MPEFSEILTEKTLQQYNEAAGRLTPKSEGNLKFIAKINTDVWTMPPYSHEISVLSAYSALSEKYISSNGKNPYSDQDWTDVASIIRYIRELSFSPQTEGMFIDPTRKFPPPLLQDEIRNYIAQALPKFDDKNWKRDHQYYPAEILQTLITRLKDWRVISIQAGTIFQNAQKIAVTE